jgi:prevent-host-death family protein
MKAYTYTEARKHFAEVLNTAKKEEVLIRRRGGDVYSLSLKKTQGSPLEIPGITTKATTDDILHAIKESRNRE